MGGIPLGRHFPDVQDDVVTLWTDEGDATDELVGSPFRQGVEESVRQLLAVDGLGDLALLGR